MALSVQRCCAHCYVEIERRKRQFGRILCDACERLWMQKISEVPPLRQRTVRPMTRAEQDGGIAADDRV